MLLEKLREIEKEIDEYAAVLGRIGIRKTIIAVLAVYTFIAIIILFAMIAAATIISLLSQLNFIG